MLRDIVGPAARRPPQFGRRACGRRWSECRSASPPATGPEQRSFGDGVVVLRRGHRSVAAIGALAEAIRRGDADATVAALAPVRRRDHLDHRDARRDSVLGARCASTRSPPTAPMIAAAAPATRATALAALAASGCSAPTATGRYGVAAGPARSSVGWPTRSSGFEPSERSYAGPAAARHRATTTSCGCYNGDTGVVVVARWRAERRVRARAAG